jgi:hypothetical protein
MVFIAYLCLDKFANFALMARLFKGLAEFGGTFTIGRSKYKAIHMQIL